MTLGNGVILVSGTRSMLTASGTGNHNVGTSGFLGTLTFDDHSFGDIAGTLALANSGIPDSQAVLEVLDESNLMLGNLEVGPGAQTGQIAVVLVSDTGGDDASITQSGGSSLTIGSSANSMATLTVGAGGTFTSGDGNITVSPTGTIDAQVSGKFIAIRPLLLDGGTLQAVLGSFELGPGLILTAQNSAMLDFTNSVFIEDGTTFEINDDGTIQAPFVLNVGNSGTSGTLVVDRGSGPADAILGIVNIGGVRSTGDVTIREGAAAGMGALNIVSQSQNGSAGSVNVESGATVNSAGVDINTVGGNTTGVLNVGSTGATSTFSLDGAGTLTVGHISAGSGTLNVNSGGRFSTGTGTTKIGTTGIIIINGGTFDLNGPITGEGAFGFVFGQLDINDPAQMSLVTADGLTLGDYTIGPNFSIGALHSLSVAGATRVVAGGEFTFSSGSFVGDSLLLEPASSLRSGGQPNVEAAVIALPGSTIEITNGGLTIGNIAKVNGFYGNGTMNIGANDATLQDSNDAVFDSAALVTLANGISLDLGANVTGFGTADTPNDSVTPLINNGNITGSSGAQQIELKGYVKGVGTCDNCNITGTDAPGFSTAAVNRGSVSYNGTVEIEIGGTAPDSGYDQLNHIINAGVATLGGDLDIQLIDNFTPSYNDTFAIMTFASSSNRFDTTEGVFINNDMTLAPIYGAAALTLTAALPGDGDLNGLVNFADFVLLSNNFNQPQTDWVDGNFNLDGITNFADFVILSNHFGQSIVFRQYSAPASGSVSGWTRRSVHCPEVEGSGIRLFAPGGT